MGGQGARHFSQVWRLTWQGGFRNGTGFWQRNSTRLRACAHACVTRRRTLVEHADLEEEDIIGSVACPLAITADATRPPATALAKRLVTLGIERRGRAREDDVSVVLAGQLALRRAHLH